MGWKQPNGLIAFGYLRLFETFLEPGGGMRDPHKTPEIKNAGKGRAVADGERQAAAGNHSRL